MIKSSNLDQDTIRILYNKNKEFIVPSLIILVCTILFFKIVIPQWNGIMELREEERINKEKNEVLKNNLKFIQNLDKSSLDSQINTVTSALPIEKDYVGIINAISNAAINAGVGLDDFSFEVGELSTKSAQTITKPSIAIDLTIKGTIDNVKRFLKNLNEEFPLSEVASVEVNNGTANFSTTFHYKAYLPLVFDENKPLAQLSDKDKILLEKLSLWSQTNSNSGFSNYLPLDGSAAEDATESAIETSSSSANF